MAEEQITTKSLDEIAAIMAAKTLATRGQQARDELGETPPNEVIEREQDELNEDEVADLDVDPSDSGDDVDESSAEGDEDGDVLEDGEDDGDESADELEFAIEDDTLIEIAEGQEIPFKDLKAIYTADETITARVQEHEQLVQEATVARTQAVEEGAKAQQALHAVFSHIDGVLAAPMITPPDEALKTTQPERYIQHLDAYNQDQQRINDARNALKASMEEFNTNFEEVQANKRKQAIVDLHNSLPQLRDPKTKDVAAQDILDAAAHYKFSPDEVNNAGDARLYRMAYDAQQYRKLMAGTGKKVEEIKDLAKQKTKRVRTLRSRGTAAQSRDTAKARTVKTLRSRAKESGRTDDVAALLAAKASK